MEIYKSKELERISCILNSPRPFGRWCISHRKYDNLVEILTRVFDHILPTKSSSIKFILPTCCNKLGRSQYTDYLLLLKKLR